VERVGDSAASAELEVLGRRVEALVPDVVGLSVTVLDHGLTFTLAASDQRTALLDVLQYLAGGPCNRAVREQAEVCLDRAGMHDRGWHLLASAMAATGVASVQSIPLSVPVTGGAVLVGGVNLYGGARGSFDGRHEELAVTCGDWARQAVSATSLSDLGPCTTVAPEHAEEGLRHALAMDRALSYLAATLAVSIDEARARLHSAAVRARLNPAEVADRVADLLQRR
jgi:hypothetical protein